MTLVALLALTTQAWATDVYLVGNGNGNWLNGAIWDPGVAGNKMTEQNGVYSITFTNVDANSELLFKFAINGTWDVNYGCTSWDANELNKTLSNIEEFGNNIMFGLTEAADVTISFNLSKLTYMISTKGMKVGDDIVVEPGSSANTWTFAMPASDVVLTPVYSAATIYSGETETPFETLKEAFANVQDGDVIKLDWNVTLAETVETLPRDGAIKFTLDLNGYIIDGMTPENAFRLRNGDYMTITDSSLGQTGGLKNQNSIGEGGAMFIFDAGRYTMGQATADLLNEVCSKASAAILLADGKEFIDLEGGAEANDGFTLRVDWKTYELTIDSKRFATFYADNKVKLVEETPAGVDFYTITGIDTDRSMASVTKLTGIVEAGTPMLVYNGTEQKQTAKIQATSDAANTANTGDIAPEFRGTATDREFTDDDMAAADYYALSGGKAFAPVKGAGTLGANQCWLQFDKQEIPSARQFTIVFDDGETTGVNEVIEVNEVSDDSWYDLSGRKLNAKTTRKGIYIKNGQKVVK